MPSCLLLRIRQNCFGPYMLFTEAVLTQVECVSCFSFLRHSCRKLEELEALLTTFLVTYARPMAVHSLTALGTKHRFIDTSRACSSPPDQPLSPCSGDGPRRLLLALVEASLQGPDAKQETIQRCTCPSTTSVPLKWHNNLAVRTLSSVCRRWFELCAHEVRDMGNKTSCRGQVSGDVHGEHVRDKVVRDFSIQRRG